MTYSKITLSDNALETLKARYLKKDEEGNPTETPEDIFLRVSEAIVSAESNYQTTEDEVKRLQDKFYDIMATGIFLPNSPTLMNAGRDNNGTLSGCFVLPVEDSLEGIFDSIKTAALVHKFGGGCVYGDSSVYIRGEGIVNIKNVTGFNDIKTDGKPHEIDPLYTISYSKEFKRFIYSKITHLWKFNVPLEEQRIVRLKGGTTLRTSAWHPCLLRDGSEKKVEQLSAGDRILTTSMHKSLIPHGNDPEFDWLMGYLLGGGCIDNTINGMRIRFFDQKLDILERVNRLLEYYIGQRYSLQKDTGEDCHFISLTCKMDSDKSNPDRKKSFFRIQNYLDDFQRKVQNPTFFLAGFLDANGHWGKDKSSFPQANLPIIQKIRELASLCGIKTNLRKRTNSKGHVLWEATFANINHKILPTIKNGRFSKDKNISHNSLEVKSISIPIDGDVILYDFTVEGTNNYLAGNGGFVVVHNTGFSFSKLRPKGDIIKSSGGKTSGVVSFMKVFSAATTAVTQGSFRRGANMGVLRIDHPEIIGFVQAKEDLASLTNFNISIAVTDLFMDRLNKDPNIEHTVINPRTNKEGKIFHDETKNSWTVGEVWNLIIEKAWQSGEPGVIFIDTMNKANMVSHIGEIESVNPCVTGDTVVTILGDDGELSSQRIDSVKDDKVVVMAYDFDKMEIVTTKANNLRKTRLNSQIIKLKTKKGDIKLTPDHEVMTDTGWIRAGDIKAGMKIYRVKSWR